MNIQEMRENVIQRYYAELNKRLEVVDDAERLELLYKAAFLLHTGVKP